MKKIKSYTNSVFIFTLLFQSCIFSDSTENLGNDYFYRNEGELVKDILCENANGGEIPATVVTYDFDDDFIIAKQKPKLPQDPLYEKEYKYNRGNHGFYYWLIIKNENLVFGPLNLEEFNILIDKYKVSKKLVLK